MKRYGEIGVVILAAGSSSRLGHPKQLVEFRRKSLLQHSIDTGNALEFGSHLLVLGANSEEIRKKIEPGKFKIIQNNNWEEGMASSLRLGVQRIMEKEIQHILVLLADQPLITTAHLENLVEKHLNEELQATFSKYDDDLGVPAIFSRSLFPKLLGLKGDHGAKKLLYDQDLKYDYVVFEKGNFDVDTIVDVEILKNMEE